jgi:hypothetical protein
MKTLTAEQKVRKAFPKRDYSKVPKQYRAIARQFDRQVLKIALKMVQTSGLLRITSYEKDPMMIDKVVSSAAIVCENAGYSVPSILVLVGGAE